MSSRDQLSNATGHGPSLEDLRLFQRLMRIARLLQTHDPEEIWSSYEPRETASALSTRDMQDHGDVACDKYDTRDGGSDSEVQQTHGIENANAHGNGNEAGKEHKVMIGEKESSAGEAIMLGKSFRTSHKSAHTQQLRQSRNQEGFVTGALAQHRHQQHQRPHAAIERRYRLVLNSKIQQLHAIIPASATFTTNDLGMALDVEQTPITQKRPSKSAVLDNAIQYINHLVYTYEKYEKEQDELTRKLQHWLEMVPPATEKSGRTDR